MYSCYIHFLGAPMTPVTLRWGSWGSRGSRFSALGHYARVKSNNCHFRQKVKDVKDVFATFPIDVFTCRDNTFPYAKLCILPSLPSHSLIIRHLPKESICKTGHFWAHFWQFSTRFLTPFRFSLHEKTAFSKRITWPVVYNWLFRIEPHF